MTPDFRLDFLLGVRSSQGVLYIFLDSPDLSFEIQTFYFGGGGDLDPIGIGKKAFTLDLYGFI